MPVDTGRAVAKFCPRATAMGWLSNTLWVADRSLSRLSFFDLADTLLRSVRFGVIFCVGHYQAPQGGFRRENRDPLGLPTITGWAYGSAETAGRR